MALLIDQNISKKRVESIQDLYPGSVHLSNSGLVNPTDLDVWKYALDKGLVLISTDSGFLNYSILADKSPKTIYIKGEIMTSNKLEWILRVNFETIEHFVNEDPSTCLTIQA
jgi:predicted nuclease of predicted toxin-antitoxin system